MKLELPVELRASEAEVRTEALTKKFGKRTAVSNLDLTVPKGSVYVLVGPNGAGKTTTFRMLLGLMRPTSGRAIVGGIASSPAGSARAHIGYIPEARSIPYEWIKVRDLLSYHARYYATWDNAYAKKLCDALELRMDSKYGKLSKGEARRAELVMALAHRPSLLLMDEPTDGLDPVVRATVLGLLAEHMTETETTMLVATHLVHEMERFADHIGVIADGRLRTQVSRETMQMQLRRYLLDVPEQWSAPSLPLTIVKENGSPRERRWTVWGDESDVRTQLTAAGANVRSVSAISLEDAAVALLAMKENA